MYKLALFFLILSLFSCVKDNAILFNPKQRFPNYTKKSKEWKQYIANNCVAEDFVQGQDDEAYGINCIESKQVVIETSKKGELVSTSTVLDDETGLNLAEDLDFQNKFYTPSYTILTGKGDDKEIPFLLKFLPKTEKFTGSLDTKYHIIFKTVGNYLILFKASKNLKDIPYTERTSLKVWKSGKMKDYGCKTENINTEECIDKNKVTEEDYYMVPFIGYPIQYCNPETILNVNNEKTRKSRLKCADSRLQSASYIKAPLNAKQTYKFKQNLKTDLFPAEYFSGLWYFSQGPIETTSREAEIAPFAAFLIQLSAEPNLFKLKDMSGEVEDRNRRYLPFNLPVKRLEFEMALAGEKFESFSERENEDSDTVKRPYAQILFDTFPGKLIDLTITPAYFSFTSSVSIKGQSIKLKSSFLRATAVDTKGFTPKRWFKEDHAHIFGILETKPQDELKQAENTEEDLLNHYRMIRFNTSLNTKEEKETKTKNIQWHFSKNSTKDPEYRAVAQTAVDIYNQAFQQLTKDKDKKIKIELVKENGEYLERDLGDLRYNIINLVKTEDLSLGSGSLLGAAPSYVNPNTGQIIGTTSNIFVHNTEQSFHNSVRNYMRYEIFQKDKRTKEENKIHAVSPYIRNLIQKNCPEVRSFITKAKNLNKNLKPESLLDDKSPVISCGKKLTKPALLAVILHEMGHSFGLAHNFKGSIDKANYYESEQDIKTSLGESFQMTKLIESFGLDFKPDSLWLAQSSSVMDYIPGFYLPMIYLGKYDLAALRYLYLDEVEGKQEGEFISLNIKSNPNEQSALTRSVKTNKKTFLHCSDDPFRLQPGDLTEPPQSMCLKHDYGWSPEEISKHDRIFIKRALNASRYRYDLDENIFKRSYSLSFRFFGALSRSALFYHRWLELRNDYLESQNSLDQTSYIFKDPSAIENYKDIITTGLGKKEEYDLYYPIRDLMPQFVMELINLDEMTCQATDSEGKQTQLTLESIKNTLKFQYGDTLYVTDCYSQPIVDFLAENNLALTSQTGYENFSRYYPETNSQSNLDVIPISNILTAPFIMGHLIAFQTMLWWNEPDKLKTLTEKAQANLLAPEKNKTPFEVNKNLIFLNSALAGLHNTLSAPDKEELLTEHINHMKFVKFEKSTGPESFYRLVIEPLSKGVSIEDIEIPFLTEAYIDFKDSLEEFQNYILKRRDTVNNEDKKFLIIPFKPESFSAQIIQKYNENQKKIKVLEERTDLSAVEELNKEALKQYEKALLEVMDNSRLKHKF